MPLQNVYPVLLLAIPMDPSTTPDSREQASKKPRVSRQGAFHVPTSRVLGVPDSRNPQDFRKGRDQRSIDLSDRTVAGCVKEEQQACKT